MAYRAGARRQRRTSRRHLAVAGVAVLAVLVLLTSCLTRTGRSSRGETAPVRFAAGATQGVYYAYVSALAVQLRQAGTPVTVQPTNGSLDNLRLLADRRMDCALAARDASALAVSGEAPFTAPVAVQALARVYDDYLHLVVPRGSRIRTLDDLVSHRVSVGPDRSGTRLMVDRLLQVAGLDRGQLDVVPWGINESLTALEDGTIDAFFWSGGIPTSGVETLSAKRPITLVPLGRYAGPLRQRFDNAYRQAVVPAGAYRLEQDVDTIAVANDLICVPTTSDAVVQRILGTLFATRRTMAERVPQAMALDRRNAVSSSPIPLHPAARAWYRDTRP